MRSISDAIATFEIKEAVLAFISPYLPEIPDPQRILNNILHNIWVYVGYPLIKLCVVVCVLSTVAGTSAYVIRKMLIPKAIMNEVVYFDFSAEPLPYASLNVLRLEQQWEYVQKDNSPGGGDDFRGYSRKLDHYFTPGALYNVDMKLVVPLSARNKALGRFMVHMSVFDSAGDAIARSSRPVIIYTQHDWCHFVSAALAYPFRLLGLLPRSEAVEMTVPFMSRYQEPRGGKGGGWQHPPTESFDMVSRLRWAWHSPMFEGLWSLTLCCVN
jgi:hypothetical protein